MRIIVLFNLRPDVTVDDYEDWARKTDIPIVNGLTSIKSFTVHKSVEVLGSDMAPPYQYIEVLDVANEVQFSADVSTDTMKAIAAEFQKLADNPIFIKTSSLEA
ncbi:hypothetical protein ACIQUB_24895 [Rhizobium sp. NPDC090275]|uniref:hypothetical protein n=1 Tax=Rhizobium sp. NPDC090275 TaxID=3364498 RepID=UPI00383A8080